MAYYDALVAKWATLSGSTAAKLAAINALTLPQPERVDVPQSQVVRYLAINGKLATLLAYAKSPPASAAGVAAAELAAVLNMGQNAPPFYTSQSADFTALQTMLNALASDTNSGLAAADVTALLALSQPPVPWWSVSVANGGGGLSSPVAQADLTIAGGLS